jgi:hypothetical protein
LRRSSASDRRPHAGRRLGDGAARHLAPRFVSDLSAEEVANYTTDRFIREPDLWRVQVRTIRSLSGEIEQITLQSDRAAGAVRKAEYLFLTGPLAVSMVLGTAIAMVTL